MSCPALDTQLLLGYDVRKQEFDVEQIWPPWRRQQYLVLPDIAKPLSTDTAVWPAVLRRGSLDYSLEQWIGPLAPIWEELEKAKRDTAQRIPEGGRHFIAIALTTYNLHESDVSRFQTTRGAPIPSVVEPSWKFLGYDVSDASLLSGLMNCGLPDDPAKRKAFRARWSASLNANHMFVSQDEAYLFREDVNARAPEHAPFFTFGIWSIGEE